MKDAGREFMRKTRYENLEKSQQESGKIPQPPLELETAPDAFSIPLPDAASLSFPDLDLRTAIEKRSTIRRYCDDPLSVKELAYLLWLTQGVKAVTKRPVTLRNVPSAGARHAFETYLLINRVNDIQPGIYRYAAIEHALLPVNLDRSVNAALTHACLDQSQVANSAVTFFWVAVLARMYWRYGERGYRYLHLDAGHICQNLYLAAEQLGCGVCAIAAFDDVLTNTALGVDGEELFTVYAASLGKR
jgi:SagB-type dehydrogenase family enzyme